MTPQEIKDLRIRLGWSQSQLAKHVGVKQPTIFRIEQGQKISGPLQKVLEDLRDKAGQKATTIPQPA